MCVCVCVCAQPNGRMRIPKQSTIVADYQTDRTDSLIRARSLNLSGMKLVKMEG